MPKVALVARFKAKEGKAEELIAAFRHHLLHALRESERFYNGHRPHQGIANACPLRPLPPPIIDLDQIAHLDIRRRQRLGGILHEYEHAA